MDQNKTLKSGDLVKYLGGDSALDDRGFKRGQIYEVKGTKALGLRYNRLGPIQGIGFLDLVDSNGDLTDYADYFAKHACPLVLPRGQANG